MVVYGRGKGTVEPGVVRLCPDRYGKANALLAKVTGIPYGGCLWATRRLKKIILREQPDVVHLQCVNGNFVNIYRLVAWLKARKIKTLVSLHGEFLYTEGPGQEKMRRAFSGFGADCVVCAVSPWTAERGKQSDILKDIPFHTVYTETDPGFAGNTATNTLKPATLETGAEIKVPLFVNVGDMLKIDTRTGEYLSRA